MSVKNVTKNTTVHTKQEPPKAHAPADSLRMAACQPTKPSRLVPTRSTDAPLPPHGDHEASRVTVAGDGESCLLDLVSRVTKAVRGYRGHGAVSCSALVQGVVSRQQWYWRSVGFIPCPCSTCLYHDSVASSKCVGKRKNKAVGRACGDSHAVSLLLLRQCV